MKGMRKFLFMMALVGLLFGLATATSWAQLLPGCPPGTVARDSTGACVPIVVAPTPFSTPSDNRVSALNPFQANRTRTGDDGTKVFPAGTVNEPGSMLLYLVDLGVKGGPLPVNADGTRNPAFPGPRPVNFLSVTNVHPTAAVTIHIRYLAATTCADVLDFLIVLTPNDIFQFNPFDLNIPRPDGTLTNINTAVALTSPSFPGSANFPADGRFLIFISASGAFETVPAVCGGGAGVAGQPPFPDAAGRHVANILFPTAIFQSDVECGGSNPLPPFAGHPGQTPPNNGVDLGTGGQRTSGRNLTILTAKHISFNFLIGSQTQATLVTTGAGAGERRAFGNSAWARPAVVFSRTATATPSTVTSDGVFTVTSTISFDRDGDGLPADFRVILSGQEDVLNVANETSSVITNDNFLRAEIQDGFYTPSLILSLNTGALGSTVQTRIRWRVRGGGLAWDRIFATDDAEVSGAAPNKQLVEMLSVADNYSGTKNVGANANDRAPSLWPAGTLLFPAIYDNHENLLTAPPSVIDVSPPPPIVPGNLLAVICLDVIQVDSNFARTGPDFGDFSIADLFTFSPGTKAFLNDVPNDPAQGGQDVSAGWIRFSRLEQRLLDAAAIAAQHPFVCTNSQAGSPVATSFACTPATPRQTSFVFIGRYRIQFRELGAAYWMHGVADEGLSVSNGGSSPTP